MSGGTAIGRRAAAAVRQRVLRRRRVRAGLRAPDPDRAARRGRLADGAHDAAGDGEHVAGHRGQPARHHGLLAGARCRGRARGGPPARAGASRPRRCRSRCCTRSRSSSPSGSWSTCTSCSGEMIPKNIALAGPDRAALVLGPPIWGVVTVLRPVIVVINAIASAILQAVRRAADGRGLVVVHPRGGRRPGRGVARRGADQARGVRPAGRRARLHREAGLDGADGARDAHDRTPRLDRRRRRGALRHHRLQPVPGRGRRRRAARLPAHQGRARDRRGPPAAGDRGQVDPAVRDGRRRRPAARRPRDPPAARARTWPASSTATAPPWAWRPSRT